MKPVTKVEIQKGQISETEMVRFATISRYGQETRRYRVSAASEDRLRSAIHGRYTCKWPRFGGWYANIYVSQEQINAYYRGMA